MRPSPRRAVFARALVAFVSLGCYAAAEAATDRPVQQAPPPRPVPGAGDEKDAAIPLEFKAPFDGDWSDVKPGEAVRLIGTCKGLKNGAVEIVAAGRSYGRRPAQPAADVSAAFAADAAAADKKYKDRHFAVEGVCVAINGGTLRMSGAKRAAATVGEKPLPKDALTAKPDARFEADDVLTKKVNLVPHTGKVIEVTGRVHTLSFGSSRGALVGLGHFEADGQQGFGLIQCLVLEEEPWRRLTYDQTVTIRGKLDNGGLLSNLSACVIVKEGAGPATKVTAEDLAREYKKDKKATDNKYRVAPGAYTGKSLVVAGEVLGWGKDNSGKYIELKGAGGVTVRCYPAPSALGFPEFEAPAGAKVELVARYATFGTDDAVWMNLGLVRVLK